MSNQQKLTIEVQFMYSIERFHNELNYQQLTLFESATALVHSSLPPHTVLESTVTEHWTSDLLLRSGDSITYPTLVELRRRGLRTGNWRHLDTGDRALFHYAFWVAKVRGKISNTKLMVQVLKIALKLVEGVRSAILEAGRRRAALIIEIYGGPRGVFSWAPQVRQWLREASYVRFLGVLVVNSWK